MAFFCFFGLSVFLEADGFGLVGSREAVSAHIPDRGGDLWIIITLTMTRLHVLIRAIRFLNMGSVFGVLVLGGILSTGQMNRRRLWKVSTRATVQDAHASKLFGCAHHWCSPILGSYFFLLRGHKLSGRCLLSLDIPVAPWGLFDS